jgi:hypothetical protein
MPALAALRTGNFFLYFFCIFRVSGAFQRLLPARRISC